MLKITVIFGLDPNICKKDYRIKSDNDTTEVQMIDKAEIKKTLKTFNSCVPFFIAMSDEYRQQLIMDIAEAGKEGINVSNLSAKSKLSRPAISHHLKVLKDSGLIKPLKVGTQIFYQLNLSENFKTVSNLINSMENILKKINEIEPGK